MIYEGQELRLHDNRQLNEWKMRGGASGEVAVSMITLFELCEKLNERTNERSFSL